LGHWKLDETAAGPVVNEVGADGTNNGATINQPGRDGAAYSFDGANDKVDTELNSVVPGTGPMSVFGWLNTSAAASSIGQYLFGNYVGGQPGRSALQIHNGELSWFIESDVRSSGVAVNDGLWHHVGVTRDAGDDFHLWIDGAPHAIGDYSTAIGSGTYDWLMGGRTADNLRNYAGVLDDMRVYNRVLSRADVYELPGSPSLAAHWKLDETAAGPVADAAGNYDGTNIGATINKPGKIGEAYFFDGVNDKIDTNTADVVPVTDPFTILAWIKTSDHQSGGVNGQGYIFSNWESGDVGRSGLSVLDGELNWFGTNSGGTSFSETFAGKPISDDLWHLVAITRDAANDLGLWVDGQSLLIVDNFAGPVGGLGKNWFIGGRGPDENRDFHGSIDDVRVFHRALGVHEMRLLAQVPEPGSLALLLLGAGAMGLISLRQRRRAA
jgi:hypothetical protein